jgi:hypothetical protein
MPPHRVFIEACLGGGAILRHKKPAMASIGIDADPAVIASWKDYPLPGVTCIHANAISWLESASLTPDTLVYCDPPYLMETRSTQQQIYLFELADRDQHARLIDVLKHLDCMVMLSGYESQFYADLLPDWRTHTYQTVNRRGTLVTEWLWMNYPQPFELHDYQYLGSDFREREKIKRKIKRWRSRLAKMPALERQAMMLAINEIRTAEPALFSDTIEDPITIQERIQL